MTPIPVFLLGSFRVWYKKHLQTKNIDILKKNRDFDGFFKDNMIFSPRNTTKVAQQKEATVEDGNGKKPQQNTREHFSLMSILVMLGVRMNG